MIHGGDIYSFLEQTGKKPLDFSENTSPLGLPDGVKAAIIEAVDLYGAYPDIQCRKLKEAVSAYYQVESEYLLFGNGAADLIFKIAYGLKPKTALVLAPTFAEYELALKKVGCKITYEYIKQEEDFLLTSRILNQIPGKEIIFICNPNNPTGQLCDLELLMQIANKCQEEHCMLVIDECFMDFVTAQEQHSFLKQVNDYSHVIILKAFTKLFAMAGLRLGFAICSNHSTLETLQDAGQPWSVSTVAQVAGIAACKEICYVKQMLEIVKTERVYLTTQLRNLGYQVWEGHANYLFFKGESDLKERLYQQGIMIRSCSNYVGLDKTYYRIAVKTHKDNETLIGAMEHGKINYDSGDNIQCR